MRNEHRQPLPRQPTREGESLAMIVDSRALHSRSKDDEGRQQGADAAGSRSVTIAAGATGIIHHGLNHEPIGWRIIDATGKPASHIHSSGHHIDPGVAGTWIETHYILVSSVPQVFVEGFIIPNDALVASDTNYATLSFGHYNPSTTTFTPVGAMTTKTVVGGGTGDWVAGHPLKLSDYSAIASSEMAAGIVMAYDVAKTPGPGVQLPDHEVILEHTLCSGCWVRRVSWDSKELILSNENNYDLTLKVEVF